MTTETNAERFKQAEDLLAAIIEMGDGHGKHKEGIEILQWLIKQAERSQKLEKEKMRLRRALKHITVFPTHFSHDQHSKRALKIARKALKGTTKDGVHCDTGKVARQALGESHEQT